MSKKILSLISFLFLLTVLAISCSNGGKTGSDDSNSGTGDGGTTTQGIKKYAGTWDFKEDSSTGGTGSGTITIKEDGSVNVNTKGVDFNSNNVTDKGNETYEVKFVGEDPDGGVVTLTLKFNNDNKTGSYEAPDPNGTPHNGTLTKQQ